MTLAPLVDPTVHGIMGKPVELADECVAPGCHAPAQQRHHLWPKSYLRGQPYEWVSIQGVILANSVGACMLHHNAVTGGPGGHRAKIVYDAKLQIFTWWENEGGLEDDWVSYGPLTSSPLVQRTEASVVRKDEGLCPGCGRPAKRQPSALPKRKTKTWSVKVPDDAEDGAVVLDEYIDDLSVALGYGDESKGVRRFHVLANVLLWVTQMKPEFLADWEESNAA